MRAIILTSSRQDRAINQSGFTLLEVLIVVTIIGMLAGIAVLSIGGTERRELQQEALLLNRLIDMAISEATFQHQNFGVVLEEQHYSFFRLDENSHQWIALNTAPWQDRSLPDFATFELQLEGEAGSFELLNENEENKAISPSLLVLASGEITPFRLNFYLYDETHATAYISSDGFNPPALVLGNVDDD